MKTKLLLTALALSISLSAFAEERPASSETKPAQTIDLNKDAYHRACRAVAAETFDGAELMLGQIDLKGITDPDVASYVALSTKIASFCVKLGIPRDSGTSVTDIIKNVDYTAIVKYLTEQGVQNVPAAAAALISDAWKIKNQLPMWNKLEGRLNTRYGQPE